MKLYVAAALALGLTLSRLDAQTAAAYQAYINSLSPSYYFTLDSTLSSSAGPATFAENGSSAGFTNDFWGNSGGARFTHASSDGLSTGVDMINGGGPNAGNASATGVGSLSLLFYTLNTRDTSTGQRFIFAQGAVTSSSPVTNNAFALFMENNTATTDPSSLRLRAGNTTTSLITSNNILPSTWYSLTVTWDETRNAGELKWYVGPVGGTLNSGSFNINDASVVGNDGTFYLGNKDAAFANGFRLPTSDAATDELAIWSRELSSTEVNGAFAAIQAAPEPSSFALIGLGVAAVIARRRK